MCEQREGIYLMRHHLLEIDGNHTYIRKHSLFSLTRGSTIPREGIIEKLIEFGYAYSDTIGDLGTYKQEWSLLSCIDSVTGNLIQIEWFDTEIDSIIEIDARTGERSFREDIHFKKRDTSNTPLEQKTWSLNHEIWNTLIHEARVYILGGDFLPYISELTQDAYMHITELDGWDSQDDIFASLSINHIDELLGLLREREPSSIRIYTKFSETIKEFLQFHEISGISVTGVDRIGLESYTRSGSKSETIIADDIIGEIFVKSRRKKSLTKNLDLLLSLTPWDLVVHREHGIARFFGMIKKTLWELTREYIELHYAWEDKVFVPITEIYRISKYVWRNDVELTSLSGKEWEKTIEKTNEEIEAIAQDILETSAKRTLVKWRAFASFRDKEKEFQKAFPYTYTRDQLSAIEDIFADMENELPMDRLISGDVGFGKTEIAMNAIYKAVLSGTQVAVISPLLVLADEHYETFCERLGEFGVRVGIMTRMQSERENTETLKKLKEWTIDVVVGTHRLLSDDISFKKLGLLVIDEEHKFWVTHKEKIKKIRVGIDILSLSATPIPRSLNLALSGLKKISLLATPPSEKKPIKTIITKWNESVIKKAIEFELGRGWQIIIVHNRIRGMESLKTEIETILEHVETDDTSTDPSLIITHGQMPTDDIEDRIHAFKKRKYHILLTTTIIENGVNFLGANTIIILDPEDFGLASLHQLRGRVWRKKTEGFCYLMYRKWELAKHEKERLITIANNTHLGAGFEIAMRDMEIRWAGDVLGIKQSGKSKDVGLTLYFRMLEERIEELKNAKKKKVFTKIELEISHFIPDSAFLSEQDKLNFYREIENIESIEELEEVEEEMMEKIWTMKGRLWDNSDTGKESIPHHSDIITHISHLFLLLRARLILSEYNVIKVSKVGVNYVFDLAESTTPEEARRFLERFDRKKSFVLLSMKKIRVETRYWKSVGEFLEDIV